MKRTLFILMALGSIASGATVVTNLDAFDGKTSGANITLGTADVLTMTLSGGKSWKIGSENDDWTNTGALDVMNKDLGTSLTADDINAYAPVSSGQGGSWTDLTLDINGQEAGAGIIIYTLGTSAANTMAKFAVTGLAEGYTVEYATADGSGFVSDATYTEGALNYTLIKITGSLTDADIVLSARGGNKNAWGMLAYYTLPTDLYWEAGSGKWNGKNWSETDGDATNLMEYIDSVNIHFTGAADPTTITLTEDVTTSKKVTVMMGTYNFKGAGSLTAANMDINFNGAATFDTGLTVTDTLNVAMGFLTAKTATIKDAMLYGGTMTVSGELQLTGTADLTAATLTASSGKINKVVLQDLSELQTEGVSLGTVEVNATGGGAATISGATLTSAVNVLAGDLILDGDITVDLAGGNFVGEFHDSYSDGNNGYKSSNSIYTVVTGNTGSVVSSANWIVGTFDATWQGAGKLLVTGTDYSTYWVNEDAATSGIQLHADTTDITLNGGTLTVDTSYSGSAEISTAAASSTVKLTGSGALNKSSIAADASGISLDGTGIYSTEGSASLHDADGVKLASTWAGTVATGDLTSADALNVTSLSNADSMLSMGTVKARSLTTGAAASTSIASLTVTEGASTIGSDASVGAITLGTADTAASLTVTGSLAIAGTGTVTFGNEASTLHADSLTLVTRSNVLNVVMSGVQLAKTGGDTTLITLETAASADILPLLNNGAVDPAAKHKYQLFWNDDYTEIILSSVANPLYLSRNAITRNGKAGASMIGAVLEVEDPQADDAPDSDMRTLLDAIDASVGLGDHAAADELMAAAAGASTAALGMALAGDVGRQLRAIRNRTTTMGVNQTIKNENMPYYNAWINAEGNFSEMDEDGTEAGYSLDSWGGTLGVDVDLTPTLTAGMAITSMYGDFKSKGAGELDGDLDTIYLSAFARYGANSWSHTFIGTIGWMDSSLTRTVGYAGNSYTAKGSTDGMAFGLMYEAGRVFSLDEEGETCLQPVFNIAWRHVSVNGYDEKGGSGALNIDDQTMDTITIGAGARLQTVVGENLYNRASILEARVLAKADIGDRYSSVNTALAQYGAEGKVRSAEMGVFALEIGAGISLPISADAGVFFVDGTAELRSGYTNFNATVGYRVNF